MRRTIFLLSLLMVTTMMYAVPAKRGVWKTLPLGGGAEVRAQLCGDERVHYWKSEAGVAYVLDSVSQVYVPVDHTKLVRKSVQRRFVRHRAAMLRKSPARRAAGYTGTKRGLVILVEFNDVGFKSSHDISLYENILNTEDYTSGDFRGSVHDYFKAQSGGLFDLEFDVFGPVVLDNSQRYYGSNDREGNDKHPGEMVVEACQAINDTVDFSVYDWSGDGYVDQVYVVYAGKGEADGGGTSTIWPHEWTLTESDYGEALQLDGVAIDTYACGPELSAGNRLAGIGVFCHEFSHCLGIPDFYDTAYAGYYGMGDYDLMCSGSYNGGGFVPAGYTAYEKWHAGWLQPEELDAEDLDIDSLRPMSQGGGAYVIYNKAHPDEYYLVENRQQTGWDVRLPGKGLMVTHVDYDEMAWTWNIVNSVVDYTSYAAQYPEYEGVKNDHERMTIFHADNEDDKRYWNDSYYTRVTTTTDLYPYAGNDSLTSTSRPAATLYNENTDGSKFMGKDILDIRQHTDGTVSFRFRANAGGDGLLPVVPEPPVGDTSLFDLAGRRLSSSSLRTSQLPQGVYVRNGRKLLGR